MSSQVVITVKKESLTSSLSLDFGGKDKPYILAYFDGSKQPMNLVVRSEPYVFDIEPGTHEIRFENGNPKIDIIGGSIKAATKVALGGIMMGAGGSFFSGVDTATSLFGGKSEVKDCCVSFSIKDGEVFKLSCQKKGAKNIKVKIIK